MVTKANLESTSRRALVKGAGVAAVAAALPIAAMRVGSGGGRRLGEEAADDGRDGEGSGHAARAFPHAALS